jgi:hypothetical protein
MDWVASGCVCECSRSCVAARVAIVLPRDCLEMMSVVGRVAIARFDSLKTFKTGSTAAIGYAACMLISHLRYGLFTLGHIIWSVQALFAPNHTL